MLDGSSGGHCGPPIGQHSIKVFGMYCARPSPTYSLFSGKPCVVQPTSAYEVDRSIRLIGSHIGRDRLNEGSKLSLAKTDFFFCLFCLSNIDDRPGKLKLIASTLQWFRQNMQMLYTTIGKEEAIRRIEGHSGGRCPLCRLTHRSTILRVNPSYDPVKRHLFCGIIFEDAVGLIGPNNVSAGWSPTETACVTQPLGFRQIGFATPELPRKNLVLRHIYGVAYDSFQNPAFCNRGTDATNMPDFAVGSHNALRDIKFRSLHNQSLH